MRSYHWFIVSAALNITSSIGWWMGGRMWFSVISGAFAVVVLIIAALAYRDVRELDRLRRR